MCLFPTLSLASRIFSPRKLEDHGLLGRLPHLLLQALLQFLAFLDDGIELLGEVFVIALFETGAFLRDLAQHMVALGLDLGDLGIDLRGLFPLGHRNLVLEALKRLLAGLLIHVRHNILGEIQDSIQVAPRDIQQHTQLGWDAARVPDVRHGGCQPDMAHALAADRGAGHFDAALVADDSFVAGILILAAVALPIAGGAKDGLVKQSVLLRAQSAIVDGFGFEYFSV